MDAYEKEISAYKEEVEKLMRMVLHDASVESLSGKPGGEAITSRSSTDYNSVQQQAPIQNQVPPEDEQGTVPPRTQEIIPSLEQMPQQVLNPLTGQVLHQDIEQDPPVGPGHVIPQTGRAIPHQPIEIVTSSEGQVSADALQESVQQPVASHQEDDTNVVSSTLPAVGVAGGEGATQEIKYKKKYHASLINNVKMKFQLLERERQLKTSKQEIEEVKKQLEEMENLLNWEKRKGEIKNNGTTVTSKNKRRGNDMARSYQGTLLGHRQL